MTVSYQHEVYNKILFSVQTKQKLISHHQRIQLEKKKKRQLDVIMYAFNSSTQEAQIGGSLESQGHSCLHDKFQATERPFLKTKKQRTKTNKEEYRDLDKITEIYTYAKKLLM